MKNKIHAVAGVVALVLIFGFLGTTMLAFIAGGQAEIAAAKSTIFRGVFILLLASLMAGATGMSLLGKRTDRLALTKQKRGPIAFMTSLIILLPCAFFLMRWSHSASFGPIYSAVQFLEIAASILVLTMVSLNIRDGLKLAGRIGTKTANGGPSIGERENGPLVAMAIPNLRGSDGAMHAQRAVAALCRCGASKNKPYCDGSHNEIDFETQPLVEKKADKVFTYEGAEATIYYNRLLCLHAAECGKRKKAAFDSSRRPWIMPDNASLAELREIVAACPSGALRIAEQGGEAVQLISDNVGIEIEENGPYRVSNIPLEAGRLAEGASAQKYVLCRCGASKNKPYCDGSHLEIGWNDEH